MIDGRRREDSTERSSEPSKVARTLARTGTVLHRRGVTADAVTAVGVVFAAGTAVAVGLGALYVGVALLIVGGLMDTLDGTVAKAAGTSSPRGAFTDSVADRLADAFIFGGVTFYLLSGHHPKEAILPVAILGVSGIVSYTRAKAESLGFTAKGGLMERAERLILLGAALLFHVVLVPILALLLALTAATAIGRFCRVWSQASQSQNGSPVRSHRVAGENRWRTWREQGRIGSADARARSRIGTELEPLGTRLRSVLRAPQASPARSRRITPRRERSTRTVMRRVDSGH